jgi:hypothetical protein
LRGVQLCSKLGKRGACTVLVHHNRTVKPYRTRLLRNYDGRLELCIANVAGVMHELRRDKPLSPAMVPKLSVQTREWNAIAGAFAPAPAPVGPIHFQLQTSYQLLEAGRRARSQRVFEHVRIVRGPSVLHQVDSAVNYVSVDELAQHFKPGHVSTIVLDLRQDDDDDDECDDDDDDCEFVVVGEAMPAWLFVVLAISLGVLALIIVLVLLAAPTEVWAPETRVVQIVHTTRPPVAVV